MHVLIHLHVIHFVSLLLCDMQNNKAEQRLVIDRPPERLLAVAFLTLSYLLLLLPSNIWGENVDCECATVLLWAGIGD